VRSEAATKPPMAPQSRHKGAKCAIIDGRFKLGGIIKRFREENVRVF